MFDTEFDVTQGAKFPYDAPDTWNKAYPDVLPIPATDWAHTAARGILHDLSDRFDIKNALADIQEDVRFEIVAAVAAIIRYCASTKDVP